MALAYIVLALITSVICGIGVYVFHVWLAEIINELLDIMK